VINQTQLLQKLLKVILLSSFFRNFMITLSSSGFKINILSTSFSGSLDSHMLD